MRRRSINFPGAMRDLRKERASLTPDLRKAWIDAEVKRALANADKRRMSLARQVKKGSAS